MGLAVDEYKENGTKMLDDLAEDRADERSQMALDLEQKKKVVMATYAATKESISKTVAKLDQRPLKQINRDWVKKQDAIRAQIEEDME